MRLQRLATAAVAVLALAACSPAGPDSAPSEEGVTTVTVRLWDEQVAAAYEESFAEFSRQNPDVRVQLNLVPWADYFTGLTLDVSSGTAEDVYWLNSSNFGALADGGKLLDVGAELADEVEAWVPAAVEQYSRGGTLWGVPALTDGRIVVYYNTAMVEAAGVDPANLTWHPADPAADTFLPAARRLTRDAAGATADQPGFDPGSVTQYGFNAGRDLQAIYYNFVGSNGGRIQAPDESLTFTDPKTTEAFGYLVDLINTHHVAPSAADTNDNGDFSRDQFLQGKMALFQSGTYNLKNIADGAGFEWGIAPLLAGPEGRGSVVNSVIAAGNADSPRRDAILRVLRWIGSEEGASFVGAEGAGLPAVTAAQRGYYDYWAAQGVDTRYFGDEGGTATIPAPSGPKFEAASTAFNPILNEVFAARTPVAEGLQQAQDTGNAALR
ncbi:ABC transporter substrate-binding protein [Pseudonocardia kunmingensis]|uniref:Carbohydrate ABC transporter substrate-binding protein (CUT1 family) n=1 Tax=Pseudonocardia kunmingensis TaxID=630975 RepID=A0A543DWZ0_9PSEU|nr:sugar ABC transporter substrate-binding protein [Pseudonocardia kunmingensis]TQM13831.1 carbohydrate ABC transporter substrate-binding protein (CUT1 family) [Pseudonocardia kunmingensis]